jgi:hypothetical protein
MVSVPQVVIDRAAKKIRDKLDREILESMLRYMDLEHAPRHALYACFVPLGERDMGSMVAYANKFEGATVKTSYVRIGNERGVQIEIVQPALLEGPGEERTHPKIALIRLLKHMEKATWIHDNYGWRQV